MEFEGKIVMVSGGANGIGAALVIRLLDQGASVIAVDTEPFNGSELEKQVTHDNLRFFQNDAADWQAMEKIFWDELSRKNLFLHGLVNNAGLLGGDASHGGRNLDAWHKMMRAHAQTTFVPTEACHPLMRKGGSIVNMGSIELLMAAPEVVLYTAAKGAVWGMTVAYATTLAPMGIRVNMVSPGNVNTERNKAQYREGEAKELMRRFEGRTPLGRSVEPEEVADTVLFLLSKASSGITGQDIVVDCGYIRALWDPSWTKGDLREIYK